MTLLGMLPSATQTASAPGITFLSRLNGWPARPPCRRFADILADICARLGVDAVRYSFIVVDLHHLLLAGLPAHPCEKAKTLDRDRKKAVRLRPNAASFSTMAADSVLWSETGQDF
jgi:hypothetical protein